MRRWHPSTAIRISGACSCHTGGPPQPQARISSFRGGGHAGSNAAMPTALALPQQPGNLSSTSITD
jgi:hypothetical protein